MLTLPTLTDGVVRLRLPERSDVEPIVRACQDPAIGRFTRVPWPYGRQHAQAFVRNAHQELRSGRGVHLVITPRDDDRVLGACGLVLDPARAAAEIGYWVAPEARRRGVATAAVRLLAGWAFDGLGVARLQLMVDVRNVASQAVAQRAGFVREGVLRSWEERLGQRVDFVVFSMLPHELPPTP